MCRTAKPEIKDDPRLTAQNAEGTWFFGMDGQGEAVTGSDPVVEIHATMDAADLAYMVANQSFEVYSTVQQFSVKTSKGVTTLPSPGRIRPRGQSTLAIPTCYGFKGIPYLLDFASANSSQTLFGVEKGYLRNHLSDGASGCLRACV